VADAALQHRFAAIFSADAAGYTRLLADDPPATIRALAEARDLFTKGPVRASVELKRVLHESAAALPEERRLLFRSSLG
jgi:hypothetical protein